MFLLESVRGGDESSSLRSIECEFRTLKCRMLPAGRRLEHKEVADLRVDAVDINQHEGFYRVSCMCLMHFEHE